MAREDVIPVLEEELSRGRVVTGKTRHLPSQILSNKEQDRQNTEAVSHQQHWDNNGDTAGEKFQDKNEGIRDEKNKKKLNNKSQNNMNNQSNDKHVPCPPKPDYLALAKEQPTCMEPSTNIDTSCNDRALSPLPW